MSTDYYVSLLYHYQSRGILVDTNLLLVYFVGCYDPARIQKFKRTSTFTVEDFYTLERIFKFFSKIITIPNVLTELNSFSNQLPEEVKRGYYEKMCELILKFEEHYLVSSTVCSLEHFQKFGLTDSAIISLVKDKYLVMTDDFKLANFLQSEGTDVINFNHIRTLNW